MVTSYMQAQGSRRTSGHQFYLGISRRVNANASPDGPKPLYQWGGCASPLIQSFGCSMAHAVPTTVFGESF
jgi:hypothetical protein